MIIIADGQVHRRPHAAECAKADFVNLQRRIHSFLEAGRAIAPSGPRSASSLVGLL